MRYLQSVLAIAMLGVYAPSVFSADLPVPVVDASSPAPVQSYPVAAQKQQPKLLPSASPLPARTTGNNPADLLYSLELLQQEVQQLRGMVEDQAYQIQQMREEQRDRYLDLDRRLSLLNSVTSVAAQPGATGIPDANGAAAAMDDKAAYQAAFGLIRDKKYAESVTALLKFTETYPESPYTGNAFYWLGEVQLVQGNYQDALQAFGLLLNRYPDHRKIPDAKYKLGKVYRELGDTAKAKSLWEEVVQQYAGTSTAKLAASELRNVKF